MGIKEYRERLFGRILSITSEFDEKDQVFLTPNPDRTWSATVNSSAETAAGVFFTAEGPYPADLYYYRTDLNGSSVLEKETVLDRNALLSSLNWIGQCGYTVCSLWDYDMEKPITKGLERIFNDASERRREKLMAALFEMEETMEEDDIEASYKNSLSEQIASAVSMVSQDSLNFSHNYSQKENFFKTEH